ncbi:MAG: ribosome small subunit-dependent GTPase A [Pseudomonadota bacterium]
MVPSKKRQDSVQHLGTVVSVHGQFARVADSDGKVLRLRSRQRLPALASGDEVTFGASGSIEALLNRRSELIRNDRLGRPRIVAANLDLVAVVWAPVPHTPDLFVDRYLVVLTAQQLPVLLLGSKADQTDPAHASARRTVRCRYTGLGYDWLDISAKTGAGLEALRGALRGKVVALVGQSGVGKSSIVNALAERDVQDVGDLTRDDRHGTHTTSAARLLRLPGEVTLVDSPGIRSLGTNHLAPAEVARGFPELLEPASRCRFRDCLHQLEPDCQVRATLANGELDPVRMHSYATMLAESLES